MFNSVKSPLHICIDEELQTAISLSSIPMQKGKAKQGIFPMKQILMLPSDWWLLFVTILMCLFSIYSLLKVKHMAGE